LPKFAGATIARVPTVVESSVEIAASPSIVFAYVDDYTTTQDWMYGLHSIEPVGDQVTGVGTAFDGVMKVGVSLKSRILCTAWEQDRLIEFESVKGIRNVQRWTFTDLGGGRTRVHAHITYSLPGGPAGKAMAAAMKPFVGVAVQHTSETLARIVENRPR